MRFACSTRLRGLPPRVRSWLSSGKRTNVVSTPCQRRAMKNCSACSIGQRRSRSAWRISSGVFTLGTYVSGDRSMSLAASVRGLAPPIRCRRMRAAVYLEDQRPLLRGVEAPRLHEPALDHPAVRALELDALGRRDVTGPHELAVEVGEAAEAFAELAGRDVARTGRVREDAGEAPRVAREGEAHDLVRALRLSDHVAAAHGEAREVGGRLARGVAGEARSG